LVNVAVVNWLVVCEQATMPALAVVAMAIVTLLPICVQVTLSGE